MRRTILTVLATILVPLLLLLALFAVARGGHLGDTAEDVAGGTPWTDVDDLPAVREVRMDRWSEEDPSGPYNYRYEVSVADDATVAEIVDVLEQAVAEVEDATVDELSFTLARESDGIDRPLLAYSGTSGDIHPDLADLLTHAEAAREVAADTLGPDGFVAVDHRGDLWVELDPSTRADDIGTLLDELAAQDDLAGAERWYVNVADASRSSGSRIAFRTDHGITDELRALWSTLAGLAADDDAVTGVSLRAGPDPATTGRFDTPAGDLVVEVDIDTLPGVEIAEQLRFAEHGDEVMATLEPYLDVTAGLPAGSTFTATMGLAFLTAVVDGQGQPLGDRDPAWSAAAQERLAG